MIQIVRYNPKKVKDIFKISKLQDPLSSFYEWIILETDNIIPFLSGNRIDVSKVVINRDFYEEQVSDKILINYATREMPFVSRSQLECAVALYELDAGPKTSPDLEIGVIFLEEGWLYPEKE